MKTLGLILKNRKGADLVELLIGTAAMAALAVGAYQMIRTKAAKNISDIGVALEAGTNK